MLLRFLCNGLFQCIIELKITAESGCFIEMDDSPFFLFILFYFVWKLYFNEGVKFCKDELICSNKIKLCKVLSVMVRLRTESCSGLAKKKRRGENCCRS